MLFNTAQFLLFFALVATAYFVLPQRLRNPLLLAASYYFYGSWNVRYLALILVSTLATYGAALMVERTRARGRRRLWLCAGLAVDLGFLFVFKYWGFARQVVSDLLVALGSSASLPLLHLLLPVGISFFTFQTLGYLVDVYKGQLPAERNLVTYALYVCFFPQLVAGPIERAESLLPQFRARHGYDEERVVIGLRLVLWGLFKKMVIADNLARIVNVVYGDPHRYGGVPLCLATFLFAFQILCDFSGYSDIAVGTARVLGFRLIQNFHQPYLAVDVRDFWGRWHVSLSTWFRDYVYIPLGGSRVPRLRHYANIAVTFVLSGLWHGAGFTFLAWGAIHGAYLVLFVASAPLREAMARLTGLATRPRLRRAIATAVTFVCVLVAWVFFRAATMTDAAYVLRHLVDGLPALVRAALTLDGAGLAALVRGPGLDPHHILLCLGLVAVLNALQPLERRGLLDERMGVAPMVVRWIWYLALILAIVNLGVVEEIPFIYFQF